MIKPFINILADYDIKINYSSDKIILDNLKSHKTMQLKIYPSMLKKPVDESIIYAGDLEMKYSKAYVVDYINNVSSMKRENKKKGGNSARNLIKW